MGFQDGTTSMEGVECREEMHCENNGKLDNGSRDADSASSGMSDGLRTYKRRKNARLSPESRTASVDAAQDQQIQVPQTESYVSLYGPNGHLKRQWKNILMENTCQSINDEEGVIKCCVQDMTMFHREVGSSIVVKEPDICNGVTDRCPSQTGPVPNGVNHVHDSCPGFVPNGSLVESNCRNTSEKCQRVFADIIVSDKFTSLCKLISDNFKGIKPENLLHLNLINSRMKEGVYACSPMLFSEDLERVWRKLNEIGSEMVSLSKSLSDISRIFCRDQVGCSVGGAVEEKHEVLESCAKREPREPPGVYKICTCKRCGGEADVRSCLVCDSCEEMYHVTCIEPAVKEIPPKSWYCANCTGKGMGSPHENCAVCERLNAPKTLNNVGGGNYCRNGEAIGEHGGVLNFSFDDGHQFSVGSNKMCLCKICGSDVNNSGRFKICEHPFCLNKYYHVRCLTMKQLKSYGPHWYCPSCLCRSCLIDQDDDKIVLCDSCDAAYHIYCMKPPRSRIPKGKWFCRKCNAGIQRIRRAKRAYEHLAIEQEIYRRGTEEQGPEETAEIEITETTRVELDRSRGGMDMLLTAANTLNLEEMVTT